MTLTYGCDGEGGRIVNQLEARLWGLTDDELREIQESLAELG
jgi:hypothetical protein